MNALLYTVVLGLSGGIPRGTTRLLASIVTSHTFGIPNSVTSPRPPLYLSPLSSRRRSPADASRRWVNPVAAWAAGLRSKRHGMSAYVWAMVMYWLAGVLIAGIVAQPAAYQGDAYLLSSVAAVVLGGTSLLGGKGYPVSTALSALFLTQLGQFVLALGVSTAIRTLVEAGALAAGVALHTVNWAMLRERLDRRRNPLAASV